MSKIIKLTVSNVKRLVAVEITPDGAVVLISGKNGAGKTSVLDSIFMALGGQVAIPRRPVREGADKAEVTVELDDLIVRRVIRPDGKSTLTVSNRDGLKYPSPQTLLDKLVGSLSFDPLAFMRMGPGEQLETLREIVGLDTSATDAKRQRAYDERTVVNRERKRLDGELSGVPEHPDVPDAEVSVASLAEELRVADSHSLSCAEAAHDVMYAEAELDAAETLMRVVRANVAELEVKVVELQTRIKRGEDEILPARRVDLEAAKVTAKKLADSAPDADAIRARLASVEETNAKVRDNVRRAELAARRSEEERRAQACTDEIKELDREKAAAIAGAKYPLEGLAVDAVGVVLHGLPLEQASSAEQLRTSVAIGLALNPELRVLLVRDGSLLDEDSLRLLTEMAEAADAQVWVETVSDGDGPGIVIEDGSVKGDA